MNETSLKTWILWACALFALTLTVDYFFLHFLFAKNHQTTVSEDMPASTEGINLQGPTEPVDISTVQEPANQNAPEGDGNFLTVLKTCAPEIAAQAIATPEALVEYLKKSVGAKKEDITVENYHLVLPDGEMRQIQQLTADKKNSQEKREIKFFSIDSSGQPTPVTLKPTDTLESLLKLGKTTRHEIKSEMELQDGSQVLLEKHDNRVVEIKYNNQGKVLNCKYTQCQCS